MRTIHRHPIYARFHVLVALGFLFGVVYGAFSLALPILANHVFANIAILGLVFSTPELFGVFLDIPLGAFANRFGRRHTILCSGVLLAVSALVFIKLLNPWLFILTLIFYELASQAYIIPADAELMALSPGRRAGRFNGITEGFHNFGYALGPIVAGYLLVFSIPAALWFAFAGSVIMILLSAFFLPRETHSEPFFASISGMWRRDHVFLTGLKEFRQLGFLGSYLTFLFFISSLHWGFNSILEPLYTTSIGLSDQFIGLIFAGFTLPFLLVSFYAGKYVDKSGAKGITVSGLFLMAAAMVGFGLAVNPAVLFLFALVHGIGEALLLVAVSSVIDELSSYHTKERIAGVKIFAESAGFFLGPLVAGIAVEFFDFSPTFISLGFVTLFLALVTRLISFEVRSNT